MHRRLVVVDISLFIKTNHDLQANTHRLSWQYLLHTTYIAFLCQRVVRSGHSSTWRFFRAVYLFYLEEVCFLWPYILVVLHCLSSPPLICVYQQFWVENEIIHDQFICSLTTGICWWIQAMPWDWTTSFLS